MSISVKATNQYGYSATYKLNGASISLTNVDGLTPPKANISTTPIATKDGSIFTNAQTENRNIVLTFDITGVKPEIVRTGLYYYFKVKEPVSLEIKTATRTAKIDGYVESITGAPFTQRQQIQISIICPEPYFLSAAGYYSESTGSVNVVTSSDTAHGAVFTITFAGSASAATLSNGYTGQSMAFAGTYINGDKLVIDTRQGKKSVKLNGVNALNNLDLSTVEWLTLIPYENNVISVTPNTATIRVDNNTYYEGL